MFCSHGSSSGISLAALNNFISVNGGKEVFIGLSTKNVYEQFISRVVVDSGTPYINTLPSSHISPANVFVCHSWSALFLEIIDCLRASVETAPAEGVSFWIDIFCYYLPADATVATRFISSELVNFILSIGRVTFAIPDYENPDSLSRTWCLYELFVAQSTGCVLTLAFSSAGLERIVESLSRPGSNELQKLCQAVELESSESWLAADKAEIVDHVRRTVGFSDFNEAVSQLLRDSVEHFIVTLPSNAPKLQRLVKLQGEGAGAGASSGVSTALQRQLATAQTHFTDGKVDLAIESLRAYVAQTKIDRGPGHIDTLVALRELVATLKTAERWGDAEEACTEYVQACVAALDSDDPELLEANSDLAEIYSAQEKYAASEPLYQLAMEDVRARMGAEHPATLQAMENLASLYDDWGRCSDAERVYLDILQQRRARRAAVGSEAAQSDLCVFLSKLVDFYGDQRKFVEAEVYLREILALRTQAFGAEHPDTLTASNDLGNNLCSQGKFGESEVFLMESYTKRQKVLGKEHPSTLESMNDLAVLLDNKNQLEQSELLLLDCIALRKAHLGFDHEDTIASMHNLAGLYVDQGKPEKAEALLMEILELQKATVGGGHVETIETMRELSQLLSSLGKIEAAEEVFEEVVGIATTTVGHASALTLGLRLAQTEFRIAAGQELSTIESLLLDVVKTWRLDVKGGLGNAGAWPVLDTLAEVYHKNEMYEKEASVIRDCLVAKKQKLGERDDRTLSTWFQLLDLFLQQQEFGLAETQYVQCLAVLRSSRGDEDADTVRVLMEYGQVLRSIGKKSESEAALVECLQLSEKVFGHGHPNTIVVQNNLANLYSDNRQFDKAAPLYEDCLAQSEKALGPRHLNTLQLINNLAIFYCDQGMFAEGYARFDDCIEKGTEEYGPDHRLVMQWVANKERFTAPSACCIIS